MAGSCNLKNYLKHGDDGKGRHVVAKMKEKTVKLDEKLRELKIRIKILEMKQDANFKNIELIYELILATLRIF